MMRVIKVYFVVSEATCERTYGWGLVANEGNHVIRGLELSVLPPTSREERGTGG